MNATAAKEAAESVFKPASQKEEKPGRREHAVLTDIADAELERRLNELNNERMRRMEAKRAELEEGARHAWEKDQEEFLRLCHKIHDAGGFRDAFIEAASKSNGAFSPNLLLIRDLPISYLPEELRPEGATVLKKKSSGTGRGGARSALSEKAPERGAGGETATEIIVRVVKEAKGKEMTLDDITRAIGVDEVFGAYLKKEPKGLSRKIGATARQGLIKSVGKNVYTAA